MAMARSIAASFDARLIDRVASLAARASAPTASTPDSPASIERSCASVSMAGSVLAGGATTARSSGATGRRAAMLTSLTLPTPLEALPGLVEARELTRRAALRQARRAGVTLAHDRLAR